MPSEDEMRPPTRIKPKGTSDYLAVMSQAVFKSGMAWRVVENKWDGIREAFHDFDVVRVASMDEPEIDALAQDTRVIRNRRKLNAIVSNAARMVELEAEHGSMKKYLRQAGDFEEQHCDSRGSLFVRNRTCCRSRERCHHRAGAYRGAHKSHAAE
ncbi:MAG: hypothetical protein HOH95_01560 [Dehalococcoidia bacterium]|nr:hypothetical protein [Dehalococcoidia bacterium]